MKNRRVVKLVESWLKMLETRAREVFISSNNFNNQENLNSNWI